MAQASTQNTDPLKLVREGTSQEQRLALAPNPSNALVDERTPAHRMVFASAYAAYLRYFDLDNTASGTWQPFFSSDLSAHLAIAAVQDVSSYRAMVKGCLDALKSNAASDTELKDTLGDVFSIAGSLALQLDLLKEGLPSDHPLRDTLRNLIRGQLASAFERLKAFYAAGVTKSVVAVSVPSPPPRILGEAVISFNGVLSHTLSDTWAVDPAEPDWASFADDVYGPGPSVFEQVSHIAGHNLFTSVFDLLLRVYARVVAEAHRSLDATFRWDGHEPHFALFLAFLHLFEHARTEINKLTAAHLDFYYRDVLLLKEKQAQPGSAHLFIELAKQAQTHLIEAGMLFRAGKDDTGREAFFAADRDLVANQAKVLERRTLYRHQNGPNETLLNADRRLYASPVANSEDGRGGKLSAPDQSWHPLFNKKYAEGSLTSIDMPRATVGFALASHYLWLAEGARTISVDIATAGLPVAIPPKEDIVCRLTTEKGWEEVAAAELSLQPSNTLRLRLVLTGGDPSITAYVPGTHGYNLDTDLPVLLIELRQDSGAYAYPLLQEVVVNSIKLAVDVTGMKTLAVGNDFGPVDASKPFQPFGAAPIAGATLTIGAKEVFQKSLTKLTVDLAWLTQPAYYGDVIRTVGVDFLKDGQWVSSELTAVQMLKTATAMSFALTTKLDLPVVDEPDALPNAQYSTTSRHGFLRLRLGDDFGQDEYTAALFAAIAARVTDPKAALPSGPPVGPSIGALSLGYSATQTIDLSTGSKASFAERKSRFYHLVPFGQAEQHPALAAGTPAHLLPQFDVSVGGDASESEFFIGVSALKPPANLSLLFEVVDGTANPLAVKPADHLHWSYLSANRWIDLPKTAVEDGTGGLIISGIVTLALPEAASDTNTLLPAGLHWLRVAVSSHSDAVCRLIRIEAQALKATFTDRGNARDFPAKILPAGTVTKLARPDANIKTVSQPGPTFGGRGAESPSDFYTRVSERLRHKDRAIPLWDYEHLVLDAFPQVFKVRCLNHTQYEPDDSGGGIYRELAPGHVTLVTVPDLKHPNPRNPLRPYTSLAVLSEIAAFLGSRLSCFATLHVRNPQFEEVVADFRVRLRPGLDETFYINKLRDEITRFLSPWAFAGGGSPTFGGKVYKSVLVNFVEERPYVDYLTDFKLFHRLVDGGPDGPDLSEVEGSRAISILVSAPAAQHKISAIHPGEEAVAIEECCPPEEP